MFFGRTLILAALLATASPAIADLRVIDGSGHSGLGGYDDDEMLIASTVFAIVGPIVLIAILWWFG